MNELLPPACVEPDRFLVELAFDETSNVPPEVQERVRGLTAIHDWSIGAYAGKYGDTLAELQAAHPPVEHPVM